MTRAQGFHRQARVSVLVSAILALFSVAGAAQPSWVWRNPLPVGNDLIGVTWTGSQAVAVGSGGVVLTSADGISWSAGFLGAPDDLNAVTWTGSQLVAVGECTRCSPPNLAVVHTSPDGVRWTRRDPGPGGGLFGVTSAGGWLVAVGDGGTILTSPDGVRWTSRHSGVSNHLEGVTSTGELLVAVGSAGTVLTSRDGVSWSVQRGDEGHYLRGVIWTGTQLVVVGELMATNPTRGVILTSPDGHAWTVQADHLTDRPLHSLVQTPAGLVAVGESMTQEAFPSPAIIMTSEDGISWAVQGSGTDFVLAAVAWTGQRLVAVGWSGTLLSSEDGLAWTRRSSGPTSTFRAVAATPFGFVAAGVAGVVATSVDGCGWSLQASGTAQDLLGLAASPTQVVAVGRSGTILTSPDGVTWTARASDTAADLTAVAWTGALLVAVGDAGTVLTSADGTLWRAEVSPTTGRLLSVIWTGSQLVAVGEGSHGGVILTSPDGRSWEDRTPAGACALAGVALGNGLLVAAGGGAGGPFELAGAVMTSRDGASWSGPVWVSDSLFRGVAWGGSEFVAVGNAGTIVTSRDGVAWTEELHAMGQALQSVTAGGGMLVAAGADGSILTRTAGAWWRQWIPVASHASGVGGSQWRTELALLNAGDQGALAELRFHGAGGVSSRGNVEVAPGQHLVVDDVVGNLGAGGSGALEVVSSQPLRVASRTYTRQPADAACMPGATVGQGHTGLTASEGLSAGESAWLVQLAEDDAFRTNIGLANLGSGPASADVTLLDGAGGPVGTLRQDLAAGEWRQLNRPFRMAGATDLSRAWAVVTVSAGAGVVATASVVDNRTSDPSTVRMLGTTAAGRDLWVPVACHADGLRGSQWRTDLGILNLQDTPAPVEIRYHAPGGPARGSLTVAPGQQAVLADVVGQLPATGSAALEVVAELPVVVSSRTSNQVPEDEACQAGGTTGQGYDALTVQQGPSAGETAYLLGLREDAVARTNIDLANAGPEPAEVTVSLRDGDGRELAAFSVPLAPTGHARVTRPFFWRAGRGDVRSGYAVIRTLTGSGVLASASVVDNLSNDATTRPAVR